MIYLEFDILYLEFPIYPGQGGELNNSPSKNIFKFLKKMVFNTKTVLLTGASSGIGAELAKQLARKNARLILVARREKLLGELLAGLPRNFDHQIFPCDVSVYSQVKAISEQIKSRNIFVDILILNAGISGGFEVNPLSLQHLQHQFATNFFGAVYFIEQFLPDMIQRKNGVIAGISSLASYRGMPGAAGYSASKAALTRFLESLRIDLWGTGVKISIISPGFIKSAMTDQNDFRMPFILPLEKGVQRIIKGMEREKSEVHFPFQLSVIAKLAVLVPDNFYAWMMSYRRRKNKQ